MTPPATPVTVAEILASSLDAFLSTAALHLGETLPDGRALAETSPKEAWLALWGASALLDQFEPLMSDEFAIPYRAGLARCAERFAERHGGESLPAPGLVAIAEGPKGMPSIARIMKAALG